MGFQLPTNLNWLVIPGFLNEPSHRETVRFRARGPGESPRGAFASGLSPSMRRPVPWGNAGHLMNGEVFVNSGGGERFSMEQMPGVKKDPSGEIFWWRFWKDIYKKHVVRHFWWIGFILELFQSFLESVCVSFICWYRMYFQALTV